MSFRIGENEALGESIRRIVREEIDAAREASRSARNGKGSPVHRTRKHLKKARAALRLLSAQVSRERFRREDRRLRNVARLISDIRDAEVRLETVKQLRDLPSGARGLSFEQTEEMLAFELDSFLAAFAGWQEEAAGKLQRAQAEITSWHLRSLTPRDVCRTVRKSYRNGRRATAQARKKQTAPRFHELRKRAKELWYQVRLLRPLQPAVLDEMASTLDRLGEHLGHAHDLCFVAQRLQSIAGNGGGKRGNRALQALIDARERDLWRTALALAERFYEPKPKDFSKQIARYLKEREADRESETREMAPVG